VDLQYVRLDPAGGPVPAPGLRPPATQAPQPSSQQEAAGEEWKGATGCSRDWRELARALGGDAVAAADMELLCFLENKETDAQVKLWRDARRKRLIVAYRGTEFWKVKDLVVDLKLLQEPWDVHALHRGEPEGPVGGSGDGDGVAALAPAAAAGGAVVEDGGAGAGGSEPVDIYTALAAQANRTVLLYNDLDQAMKVRACVLEA
jgi:hypothetical protein